MEKVLPHGDSGGMADRVQDPERQWETIEAAFRRSTRALKERTEADQRLGEKRDSSQHEAERVFEQSSTEISHSIRRIKELEVCADEEVQQLAPLRGRRWDAADVVPEEGIPRERLSAVLEDCEVANAELVQAAKEYPQARKEEVNRSTRNVLLIVFLVGTVLFLLCVMACCSSALRGGGSNGGLPPATSTVTSSAVDPSADMSDSVATLPVAASHTIAAATATRSGPNAATVTAVDPTAIPSQAAAAVRAAPSGSDTSTCGQVVGPTFRTLWARYRAALGCPLEPQHGLVTAYQAFEHGYMIYRVDQPDRGYALFDDGTWQGYFADWREGMPEYSCPGDTTPSTTPPTPRRGFGFVWCHNTGVRQRLGWATMDELGNWRNFQSFVGGWAIELDQVPDSQITVLLDDGAWAYQ